RILVSSQGAKAWAAGRFEVREACPQLLATRVPQKPVTELCQFGPHTRSQPAKELGAQLAWGAGKNVGRVPQRVAQQPNRGIGTAALRWFRTDDLQSLPGVLLLRDQPFAVGNQRIDISMLKLGLGM